MSNSNISPADHQIIMQQNAGDLTSETAANAPSNNPATVQYQIQQAISSTQQSSDQLSSFHNSNLEQNSPSFMPQQGATNLMTPNVATSTQNQQSDNKNIPDSSVPQRPLVQPTIQPLLSPDTDQIDTRGTAGINDTPNSIPSSREQLSQQQTGGQKTVVTKVKLSDELNIFDWFRTTDIINQLAEKAKSSVDSVITALDPGMKEYLYSGGNINIKVISEYGTLVSPIRDVFQTTFGRATVSSAKTSSPEVATSFPIKLAHGFNEALVVARERIKQLRQDTSHIPQNQVLITIQPSIVHVIGDNGACDGLELDKTLFTSCYLTYCLVLEDPVLGLTLSSYSQFIPLDSEVMTTLNQNKLQDDSPQSRLGYTMSIDDLMNSRLKVVPQEGLDCQWLQIWANLDIVQIVKCLCSTLALMYRRKWTDCVN